MGRVLGLALLALVFAGCIFLLTCQKNPRGTNSASVPQHSVSEQGTAHPRHSRHSRTHEEAKPAQPAQPEQKAEEQPADSASSTPETTASQEGQSTEQPVKTVTPAPTGSSVELPHERHLPPTRAHSAFSEVSRGNARSTKIAVTFDAGADSRPAAKILDVLASHNVHATFFLTGKWIEKNPGLARRVIAEGHEIGNHTYFHRRLTELSSGEIAEEVERTEQLALDVTGHSTKPYLRVPYGSRDRRVLTVLSGLGYRSIYWDLDCWDSVKKNITSAQIEDRVMGKIRNGSIVLMHCGSQPTADALDSLLQQLESAGYQTVIVSDLLGD